MPIGDQLRDAVKRSGLTRYRVAKDSGVDYSILVRFLDSERNITLSTAERLCDYFGMRLTKPQRVRHESETGRVKRRPRTSGTIGRIGRTGRAQVTRRRKYARRKGKDHDLDKR